MSNNLPVTQAVSRAPAISAEAYQHVGRFAGGIVMAVFEQIGGVNRMAAWADANPSDYFCKVFPKMISRSTQVDVSGSITIDEAISRLEKNTVDGHEVVTAEFTEVEREYDL